MHNKIYYIKSGSNFYLGFTRMQAISMFEQQSNFEDISASQAVSVHTFNLPFRTKDSLLLNQIQENLKNEIFFSDNTVEKMQEVVDSFCSKMEETELKNSAV